MNACQIKEYLKYDIILCDKNENIIEQNTCDYDGFIKYLAKDRLYQKVYANVIDTHEVGIMTYILTKKY